MMRINKRARGQALIEAVCTAMILIPLALCLLDIMVLVMANGMNDSCAKSAARSAANQADDITALSAAKKAVSALHTSAIIKSVSMPGFFYDSGSGKVTVQTQIEVHLPMPFPGLTDLTFQAKDVEAIVNFQPS
jgi:hypothetical protein